MDIPGFCRNMDWTGSGSMTPEFILNSSLTIERSLIFENV